jgi:uncharacterized integral membrane protein
MNKAKGLLLLLLGALLVLFARENWHQPQPALKLLGFEILPLPLSLLIYGCLVLGFAAGWLAHALRLRKQRRAAAQAPAASTTQQQEP